MLYGHGDGFNFVEVGERCGECFIDGEIGGDAELESGDIESGDVEGEVGNAEILDDDGSAGEVLNVGIIGVYVGDGEISGD